jgi:hypothetical protein
MVRNFATTFGLMKWCTLLVPALMIADMAGFLSWLDPYLWYATVVVAAYLVVPLAINIHRELFMHATDGANDNASGVAAMLGVLQVVVPAPEAGVSMLTQPLRRTPIAAQEVGVAPREMQLEYASAPPPQADYAEEDLSELPEDFRWAESPSDTSGAGKAHTGQGALDFDTIDFEQLKPNATPQEAVEPKPRRATYERHSPGSWGDVETDFDGDGIPDVIETELEERARREALFGMPEGGSAPSTPAERGRTGGVKRLFGGRGKRVAGGEGAPVGGWLGVGKDFDVRDEGRAIGSWDNFEEDEDDLGLKGGWAGDDPIGDDAFAANEAQRIRRRVTESVDRTLADKEVWFVATGAEEAGTWGMRHFLAEYAEDLKGAFIINLDNLGTGTLHWVTKEGMARRYAADRRLTSAARKVSREDDILVKGREYKGLSTDATPALARRFKAMSVMAFDINGRLPNWHWRTDTSDNVSPENIDNAVRLVTGMLREL